MKNTARRLGQAGFTLIEILVALILISLLVAAVFPVVTQQTAQANAPRLGSDLTSIRTGIETFNVNLRNRFPAGLNQLAHPIAASGTALVGTYDAPHVNRWDGPYIDATIPAAGGTILSGFDATIHNNFVRLISSGTGNNTETVATPGAGEYVAVVMTGSDLTAAANVNNYLRLDELIDGEVAAGTASTTGRLRLSSGSVYYLAVPYQ